MSNDTTNETNWIENVGKPAFESIQEMVAALECDYDRLEEIREERKDWVSEGFDVTSNEVTSHGFTTRTNEEWAKEFPEEAEELKELEAEAGECESEENARERIQEDPLSLRIFGEFSNGEWEVTSYELLLSTGGPAVRIVGELNQHSEPSSARLEVQDWFKPWSEYIAADSDTLMTYVQCFCFETR